MRKFKETQEQAARFLVRREYCRNELVQKLVSRGSSLEVAEQVVSDLQERNMVNDERFTENLIRIRIMRGYGPVRIEAELSRLGVASEVIANHLNQDDEQWHEQIVNVAERKYHNRPIENFKEWAKRANFLRSRGFTSSQIHEAIGRYSDTPQA